MYESVTRALFQCSSNRQVRSLKAQVERISELFDRSEMLARFSDGCPCERCKLQSELSKRPGFFGRLGCTRQSLGGTDTCRSELAGLLGREDHTHYRFALMSLHIDIMADPSRSDRNTESR